MVRLQVERIVVRPDGITIPLQAAGLGQVAREMIVREPERSAAWVRSLR
jgi:site-specific DNA recombinase